MKMGHLQNIQSFETSIETGNLQTYEEQSINKLPFCNWPLNREIAPTLTVKKITKPVVISDLTITFASRVFPHPGGPANKIPGGLVRPREANSL